MNREQMIAWLALEGWVLYNRPFADSHPIISRDARHGIAPAIGTIEDPVMVLDDDTVKDWSTVSDEHLSDMFQKVIVCK